MSRYRLVTSGTMIPVPGGKQIEELFGRVHTQTDDFSLARMVAPPGWIEPPQTPEFGELTILIRGAMQIELDGEALVVRAGQALWVEPGVRVQYSNTFDEESEYFAVCIPAFHLDRANREDSA